MVPGGMDLPPRLVFFFYAFMASLFIQWIPRSHSPFAVVGVLHRQPSSRIGGTRPDW
jgi:hypothetical protein